MIQEFSNKLQELLTTDANNFAKESGFVQRKSKLTGDKFAKGLIFGWQSNPDSSLNELRSSIETFDLKISPQAIDKRFNKESSKFMGLLLNRAISVLNFNNEVSSRILSKFSDVRIYDSSSITLPVELIEDWVGSGGSIGSKTTSSVKLSVSLSLKMGSLKIVLEDGYTNDKSSELITKDDINENNLIIRDLGYFSLKSFRDISLKRAYFSSRLKIQTKVFSTSGDEIDIVKLMNGNDFMDKDVIVGKKEQLNCRIVIVRLPEELKYERLEEMKKEAKREGQNLSEINLALAGFNIFITNVSKEILALDELLVLMKARWQIELLFKLWKTYCKIDQSRSNKPYRILTELYAKLIAAIISHQCIVIGMWEDVERSMFKAVKIIQSNASILSYSFHQGIEQLNQSIKFICYKISSCKVYKRDKKPSNSQLLSGMKKLHYA